MKLTDVIRRPLITEKTSLQREDGKTLVFQVAVDADALLEVAEVVLDRERRAGQHHGLEARR